MPTYGRCLLAPPRSFPWCTAAARMFWQNRRMRQVSDNGTRMVSVYAKHIAVHCLSYVCMCGTITPISCPSRRSFTFNHSRGILLQHRYQKPASSILVFIHSEGYSSSTTPYLVFVSFSHFAATFLRRSLYSIEGYYGICT